MSYLNVLSSVVSIIHGDGTPMIGWQLSVDEAITWVRQRYPDKPYCLVQDWRWLDLELRAEDLEFMNEKGIKPVVLFANHIVVDSRARWGSGSWVRTTALLHYDEEGVFQTLNTVYVLLGEGVRQTTTPAALQSII